MNRISLRALLVVDTAMCLACGLLLTAAAGPLSGLFALPEVVLRGAGLVLLPWGVFVGWCASQPGRRAVLAVVVVNAIWAADSLLLLVSGWVAPNGLGIGFVVIQAAAIALLAVFQARSLPPASGPLHA